MWSGALDRCTKCKDYYKLTTNILCDPGDINGCRVYDSKGKKCIICDSFYFLSTSSCLAGNITNCMTYKSVT